MSIDARHTFIFNIAEGVSVKLQTTSDGDLYIDDVKIESDVQLFEKFKSVRDAALE